MKILHATFAFILAFFVIMSIQSSLAEELHMKDGSIIRGQLINETPGQNYRMKLKDGSEVVYPAEKVESVQFGKKATETETKDRPPMATGVVAPASGGSISSGSGLDNTGIALTEQSYAKNVSLGLGIGKYGTFGAEMNFRPSDSLGLSLGAGAQYYRYEYKKYYSSKSTIESGFSAMGGVKGHFYFTPRSQPSQHNIFLAAYYGEAIGPAFGLAYGYESHHESWGWDLSIGLAIAPEAKKYMAKKVGIDENKIDYTWIPLLFELGFFF